MSCWKGTVCFQPDTHKWSKASAKKVSTEPPFPAGPSRLAAQYLLDVLRSFDALHADFTMPLDEHLVPTNLQHNKIGSTKTPVPSLALRPKVPVIVQYMMRSQRRMAEHH